MITFWYLGPTKIRLVEHFIIFQPTRILMCKCNGSKNMETWTFFCKCSRWATFIGMNGMLAWNTVFNLLNIFMAEEAYHVNWRWWSSSQTKETSLSMSIKQKRDIRRLVVSWYYTGWLVALTSQATLPCYSKRWQRRLLIHVCIDIWKKIHFSEYSNVCFANVLWTGKCIQHICWTSRMHSVYIDEKHWL